MMNNDEQMTKSTMPKHLINIVNQVDFKMKILKKASNYDHRGCDALQSRNDEILEIYKVAFEQLITSVVTYSNILSEIKKAYENALNSRDIRISEFITQDRIYGISARKRERDEAIQKLIKENEDLRDINCKLTREVSRAKAEIGKIKDSHTSAHLSVALEREARYALLAENGRLWGDVRALRGDCGGGPPPPPGGDPVVLRMALDRCREQLATSQRSLAATRLQYCESVPRAEYDQLEGAAAAQARALRQVEAELQARQAELAACNDAKKSLEEELSEVRSQCAELERCGTPRPEWAVCGDFIGGGSDRWRQLSGGLSSREKLRALLKELGPAAESEHLEFFDGLGCDPSIPAYLQHSGRVRNLRLSRRELAVLIADVWRSKRDHRDVPMREYLTKYFQDRYAQPSMRAEWAYNVCAAAEQALDDLQVKLFWGALNSVLSERVYWGLRDHWDRLRDHLQREARGKEWISMEQFEKAAKAAFPLKSEVDIRNLADVVKRQLKLTLANDQINLERLFHEPAEGFERSAVSQELYRQRRAAQDRLLRELVGALGGARGARGRDPTVSLEQLKRAFAVVDPAIDHIRMERHLRWAFSLGAGVPLEGARPLPLRPLLARLAAGDIERAGPRSKPRQRRQHYK